MLIDYNVRDDWPDDEPTWVKSLVSSLYRRYGATTVLPLPVVVQEILDWLELASGVDAWAKAANRRSLAEDLRQSIDGMGPRLTALLSSEMGVLAASLGVLDHGGRAADRSRVLQQPPGLRRDPAWTDATTAAATLLAALSADAAVGACWDDLLDAAQDPTQENRQHRKIADALFEQLRLRGHEADATFSQLAHTLAADLPRRQPTDTGPASLLDRLDQARGMILDAPEDEHVVVWLGYLGGRVDHVVAGNVIFMDAHWYVPNATADRHEFVGKNELAEIVRGSMFRIAERVDEESEVDLLARVELGMTAVAGSVGRAAAIVDALLSLSVHRSGGVRPFLTESIVVHNGTLGGGSTRTPETSVKNDYYGANLTASAIEEVAPRLGEALAVAPLSRYLAAAVEVQTAADRPYSREMALRRPSDADIRGTIPLEDRVVQNVAAHAGVTPARLFEHLTELWPHRRWTADVQDAVNICLLGLGPMHNEVAELRRVLYESGATRPWLVFVAEHERDLLEVCRVESERGWISRVLRSVSDPAEYQRMVAEYQQEAETLSLRRTRVRNALVHGNPAAMPVVRSVGEFASYLSHYALEVGLDSFVAGDGIATVLLQERTEMDALRSGLSAADYWRARAEEAALRSATSP